MAEEKTINSLEAFEIFLNTNPTAAIYFSTPGGLVLILKGELN